MSNQHLEYLLAKESNLENELKVVRHWIFEEKSKMGIKTPTSEILTPSSDEDNAEGGDFNDLTWNEKFLSILKENQRFMKVREIATEIVDKVGGDVDEITTQLSRRTKKLKDLEKITKYKISSSNLDVYWGSPKWLNEELEIIKGYEINKDSLSSPKGTLKDFVL
jgi:hypothetical protein